MKIRRLAIVSIPVRDQERSKGFYRDVLGFQLITDSPFQGDARWIQLAPPGAETAITLVTWFEDMPPGCIQGLVLETDDIEGAYQALSERGLQLDPIADAPWGRYSTFSDPDGNGWVLQQSTARA